MARQSLLLWGTGREDRWTVDVVTDSAPTDERPPAHRRVTGPIRVTAGRLHLTGYESLTMAAQFPDVTLPEPHLQHLVLPLPPGLYAAEITQLLDPDDDESTAEPAFVITLTRNHPTAPWPAPPWRDA